MSIVTVELPDDLAAEVQRVIAAGQYDAPSLVRAALRDKLQQMDRPALFPITRARSITRPEVLSDFERF